MASIHLESLQGLARYGTERCVRTDILVEPELQKNWKLNKGEFTVYQTWMSGNTASIHLESQQGV